MKTQDSQVPTSYPRYTTQASFLAKAQLLLQHPAIAGSSCATRRLKPSLQTQHTWRSTNLATDKAAGRMLPEAAAYLPGSITTAGDTTRTSDRLGNKPGASSSHLAQGAMARAAGSDAWRQPCPLRRSLLAAGSLPRDFMAQERQPPGPSGRGAAAGPTNAGTRHARSGLWTAGTSARRRAAGSAAGPAALGKRPAEPRHWRSDGERQAPPYLQTPSDRQTGSARQQTLRPRVGSDQIRLGAVLFDKLMQLAERNGLQDLLQATHPRTETAVSLKARCRHVRKLVSVLLLSFANFPKIL